MSAIDLPLFRSALPDLIWPAVPQDDVAQLLSLCFQLNKSEWMSPTVLQVQQIRQFRELLEHAVRTTSFYKQGVYRHWLSLGSAERWMGFCELPVLTRAQVQALDIDLLSANVPTEHGPVTQGNTSGSTGVPLRYWSTALNRGMWNAITMRDHFWHQRDFSLRHGFIRAFGDQPLGAGWGSPASALFDTGESAAMSSRHPVREINAWLQKLDPEYLLTHPVTLRELLAATRRGELSLSRIREVRTVGETVSDSLRSEVRRAWGVRVADMYSTSECGMLALQCPTSESYHAQSECAIVEILNAKGHPCLPRQIGRIVVTPLHNFAMPLIRYETGDYAEAGEPCGCGRGLPTLRKILGRRFNRLQLPNGESVWPALWNIPWHDIAPNLTRYQLRQEVDLSLTFRYQAAADLSTEQQRKMSAAILERAGGVLPITFERVTELPLSIAGKLDDFVSYAKRDEDRPR